MTYGAITAQGSISSLDKTGELKHFINCISGKETLLVSFEEMFATMKTIFAIEQSLATANAVSLEKF